MFKIRLLAILLVIMANYASYCQDCNCITHFKWLKSSFEENDAGFKYILASKGTAAYAFHNKLIEDKIGVAKTHAACLSAMQEWLRFFRKGHAYIIQSQSSISKSGVTKLPDDTTYIRKMLANWPVAEINLSEFEKYLNTRQAQDYEGVWDAPPYKIVVKKIDSGFIGVLINDVPPFWKSGQIKLEIKNNNENLKGIVYRRDHTKVESNNIEFIGQNYLDIADFRLQRVTPKLQTEKEVMDYLKSSGSRAAYIQVLDSNTLYLRIPSFELDQKKAIDSVLESNKNLLVRTPNLIIDIRGNGGGSDLSFANITPYLFTNHITKSGVEYFSTLLNNQRMFDFFNSPKYQTLFTEKQKKWAKQSYDSLQKHVGKFVYIDESFIDEKVDSIKQRFPQQVGIIIDENVGSSAEQFLLAAKQSKKVKLFGTPTFGALDIANMYSLTSPCNEYVLGYSLSRSRRLPQYPLDDRGIQPDFFIAKNIPRFKWVQYVKNILEE
jgi:hypothetical protein